jgi:hypothetical protein
MTDIDVVRELNSIFERHEFSALRDALERSDADRISSGVAEADAAVRASISDQVVVEFHGASGLPEGRRYVGLDSYLKLWRQWLAAFDEYEVEHRDYEQVEANVLVSVVHRGRGRGSGLPFELAQSQRWVVRDGSVLEIHIYDSRDEALADARSGSE